MTIKPRQIWEKGTPLNVAWIRFSDSKLRAELVGRSKLPSMSPLDFDKGIIESATAIIGQLSMVALRPQKQKALTVKAQGQLISKLAKERLLAFGFPTWPSEARIPRRIQSQFWVNAQVNWNDEKAKDESYAFQKIRIINPKEFPELMLIPKIGRSSNKDIIYEAISLCLKASQTFSLDNNKSRIELIRIKLKSINPKVIPDGPGFGDDAIRKHIKTYFEEIGIRR